MSDDYADFGENPTLDDRLAGEPNRTVPLKVWRADADHRVVPLVLLVEMRDAANMAAIARWIECGASEDAIVTKHLDVVRAIDALIASTGGDAT